MRDFVIQNNAEISPPILETSWKPVRNQLSKNVGRWAKNRVMKSTQKEEFFPIQSAQKSTGHLLVSCAFWRRHPESDRG